MNRALLLILLLLRPSWADTITSAQGPRTSPTTDYVDPTAATANGGHPMVACASGCSTTLVNQNTDALQWAVNQATTGDHPCVSIPRDQYPIFRGGASHNQAYDILIQNVQHLCIMGNGATIRATGNVAAGKTVMFQVDTNAKDIRFYDLVLSERDLSGTGEEHSHYISLGNAASIWDYVQLVNVSFIEGSAGNGDAVQLNGGNFQTVAGQRLTVTESWIDSYSRTGLSFQHGTADMNVYRNRFGPDNTPRCTLPLHHEITSGGGNFDENYVGNFFSCTGAGMIITFSGWTTVDTKGVVFANNVVLGGAIINSTEGRSQQYVGNVVTTTDGNSSFFLKGGFFDTWVYGNNVNTDAPGVGASGFFMDVQTGNDDGLWVESNQFDNNSGTASGNAGVAAHAPNVWFSDNKLTYHDTIANKFGCYFNTTSDTNNVVSGWITDNTCTRGLQSDGVTQAGLIDLGFDFSIGSVASLGHAFVSNNILDGGRRTMLLLFTQAQLTETVPVVSSNHCVAGCSLGENEPTPLRTETTGRAETLTTSGAFGPSRTTTYVTGDCGTDTDTLANGSWDGEIKRVQIDSTCVSLGTLTPTNFGDGTSISWATTLLTPNGSFRLAWDKVGGKWWLLDKTAIVTVNP